MRHRNRRPKKSSGRIVAQCTRWDPLGWGFCVPEFEPNRSIYVHCSKVLRSKTVGSGDGFVKLHKYALYEFSVLPPEPGKRYERATDITLPGGEPVPLEPKVMRNHMMEERKKQDTNSTTSEPFFSSRSTSDGGHDSSFQSDDPKQRDDSSLGSQMSHEAESIELSRSTADTVEYEHHVRRYPPGLAIGGKYARDRRKAQRQQQAKRETNYREANYSESNYNYLETNRTNLGVATHGPRGFVEPKPSKPPESDWKDIPIQPHLETEWSPVTDSEWTNINPPPKYNLNFPCQRDHAIWSSKPQSQSLWSPIYFDSVLKEEERRPNEDDHENTWEPVITQTERKTWEPVFVDLTSPWSSAV